MLKAQQDEFILLRFSCFLRHKLPILHLSTV